MRPAGSLVDAPAIMGTPDLIDGANPRRWAMLAIVFGVTVINYADRASISTVAESLSREFDLTPVQLGWIFSGFAWSYVVAQFPGGWAIDRYGTKRVYVAAIFTWSALTLFQGLIPATGVLVSLFTLRLLLGIAEAPSFPANARLVAGWFPRRERGTATSIYNAAQYAAVVVFAPSMAWICASYGWRPVFILMGLLGIAAGAVFARMVDEPAPHPDSSSCELTGSQGSSAPGRLSAVSVVRQLLGSRMLLGICLGQYCITALTYFFATWFPLYLIRARGMSIVEAGFAAIIPAAAGVVGGLAGGMISDALLRRGASLTFARKLPIVAGLLISLSIVACTMTSSRELTLLFMGIGFFGKGVASLGWAVLADVAPQTAMGLAGGVFNTAGNLAGIVTPIAIGLIVQATGSFDWALLLLAGHAIVALLSYLLLVGPLTRLVVPQIGIRA